ncbi:MAG: SPASM domain-containing protein [Eggerthellaceae bacterium]|nr:SPASM domain-containing protein [Eggerthellaceae bacterium]
MTVENGLRGRTAGEAGWHASRYNLVTAVPGTKNVAIANLFKGNCAEYTPIELYLLSVIEELDERHPIIGRFARRGIIANFDERAALEAMGRAACAMPRGIGLTICPTMGCNFDCPYCFEDHFAGKMGQDVQDDVVALAGRMLDASCAKNISVTWFGGEPLLAPEVIESLSGRLMALADGRGGEYSASIITNGYLLTQGIADMLGRCKVKSAQVTIDGLGATHDATRHLAGGGPTFERITTNLRDLNLPFKVNVRHNVHEANLHEVDELEEFVEKLAAESGNEMECYPAPVSGSDAADARGGQVGLLCGADASEVGIRQEAGRFRRGQGHYCGAHTLWSVGVDAEGNLQKCWEAVDKPAISFGTARDWDPADPLATASNPDNLTMYLNTASPVPDEECRECVWLPHCAGGCPHKRLFGGRQCVAFKDEPEKYVLALHARIGEGKGQDGDGAVPV